MADKLNNGPGNSVLESRPLYKRGSMDGVKIGGGEKWDGDTRGIVWLFWKNSHSIVIPALVWRQSMPCLHSDSNIMVMSDVNKYAKMAATIMAAMESLTPVYRNS
jgi:hypothetical protein